MLLYESDILEYIFPTLKENFYRLIVDDLKNKALLSNGSTHTIAKGIKIVCPKTTGFGKQFIQFITSPVEEET